MQYPLKSIAYGAARRDKQRWRPLGGGSVFAEATRRGDAALERLGLTHVADRPAGLLSHGDQRLLEVAMALAQQPLLLLLDEPTQGLSVEETAHAVEVLREALEVKKQKAPAAESPPKEQAR